MTTRKTPPSLRRHKPSQQGVVTLNCRDHYLGPWPKGQRKPPAAIQDAYDALITEWLTTALSREFTQRWNCRNAMLSDFPIVGGSGKRRQTQPDERSRVTGGSGKAPP
jgi:hypothetical protein